MKNTETYNFRTSANEGKKRQSNSPLISENPTIRNLVRTISLLREENRGLLHELHRTQECLERNLKLNTAEQNSGNKRIARTGEFLELNIVQLKTQDKDTQRWIFKNLHLYNVVLPELTISTYFDQDQIQLRLDSSASKGVRWLSKHGQELTSTFTLSANANLSKCPAYKSLLQVTSTSWENLNSLLNIITSITEDEELYTRVGGTNPEAVRKGLNFVRTKVSKLPQILRYDNVQLEGNFSEQHYTNISITLENVSIGKRSSKWFKYKLATVDDLSSDRGQNPRLEFPDSTRDIFENWFAETTDHRGDRLELRFAQPNLMDLNIWNKLSPADHILITSIIRFLPDQLFSLQKQCNSSEIEWPVFYRISFDLKRILTNLVTTKAMTKGSAKEITDSTESIKG